MLTVNWGEGKQPFSWKAGLLFAVTGAFLIWFFEHEKERMKRKRMAEANKGYGKARVGGPFTLRDTKGNLFTEEDLKGKFNLVGIFPLLFAVHE